MRCVLGEAEKVLVQEQQGGVGFLEERLRGPRRLPGRLSPGKGKGGRQGQEGMAVFRAWAGVMLAPLASVSAAVLLYSVHEPDPAVPALLRPPQASIPSRPREHGETAGAS